MTVRAKGASKRGVRAVKAPRSVTSVSRPTLFVFGLIGLVGSLHAGAMVGVEAFRYLENSREISRLRGDIAALDGELAGLQAILDHGRDASYREQLARRQGFAYPDEQRVFTLRPEEQEPGNAGGQ